MQVKDQMGNIVLVKDAPLRIISLVPSLTELLAYLGLEERIVGITKFCIYPKCIFKSKTRVGGTKNVNLETVDNLNPDLIIGNLEENEKSDIEALQQKYPVWMSDIKDLTTCYEMINSFGEIFNVQEKATALVDELKIRFHHLDSILPDESRKKVAYFIWQEPLMVAGGNTFINEMIYHAGYENIFGSFQRYPEITTADLQAAEPDFIFLSSEPYPFKSKHEEHFRNLCPNSKVVIVDGELFSWYGSRLLYSPEYFENLHAKL